MAWSFIGYNQKLKKTMNQLKDITGAKIVLLHFSSIKVREVLLETKQVFCNLTEFEMICESLNFFFYEMGDIRRSCQRSLFFFGQGWQWLITLYITVEAEQ